MEYHVQTILEMSFDMTFEAESVDEALRQSEERLASDSDVDPFDVVGVRVSGPEGEVLDTTYAGELERRIAELEELLEKKGYQITALEDELHSVKRR